jgi:NAD(P)-dependent dehydrogenase (short-subunit alcohol dehydrogenase family)
MDDDLIGKAAVVTGASRGIGLAAALCLSQLGVNVVMTARTQDAADAAAATVMGAVGFAGVSTSWLTTPQPMLRMARWSTNTTTRFAKRLISTCGRRSCGRLWRRTHG